MKVALFTDTYLPQLNGVAIYLGDAIRELAKKHEVILFAPGSGPLKIEHPQKNVKIYWIPSSPFPFYEGYRVASLNYKRVSDILKKEKPDIVHAHAPINLGLQGLLAAKRRKIPSVITYHTHFPDYVPHLLNGKLPKMFHEVSQAAVKKMINHIFRQADRVTAPTKELVSELKSYGLHNTVYLPNGINFEKLKCREGGGAKFRRKHRIGMDKNVAIYLGRLSFEKNLDSLLEAFKKIEKNDRVLLVAGGGPYLKKFKELAASLEIKNIVFTGFVHEKDVAAAYAAGDLFVSASHSETFGLTFVEAMYMGLPVIGVGKLGPQEIILNGKTGILVKPNRIDELATAMDKLFADEKLRRTMSVAARARSEEYSIRRSIEKTLEIYAELKNLHRDKNSQKSKGLYIKNA